MIGTDKILSAFTSALEETIEVTIIILVLMIMIEIFVIRYKPVLLRLARSNNYLAYIISSVFGAIPTCTTTFAIDSLYMSGFLSFGGLIAVMIVTIDDIGLMLMSRAFNGDISLIIIIVFFACLLILGVIGGKIADIIAAKFKWTFSIKCDIVNHEKVEFHLGHFIKEHIVEHILKKHIWKISLWMFITIFIIGLFPDIFKEENFNHEYRFFLLIAGILIGIIPSPAPNIFIMNIFILHPTTFFSVFLANSIVQDGHGLLPILGYSYKDAIKVKLFKIVFALIVGLIFVSLGY